MAGPIKPYYAPQPPVPIARQAECLVFAARDHGLGFWSYLGRFADNAAFATKGWPQPGQWRDLPEALIAAGETLTLVAGLARLRGDEQLRAELRAAIERDNAKAAEAVTTAEAIAKAGGPVR